MVLVVGWSSLVLVSLTLLWSGLVCWNLSGLNQRVADCIIDFTRALRFPKRI